MAVSANRWHPLAFDARSYGLRRTVAQSLFSHMSGALPPPRLLGAIDTGSPTTHPPTQRRFFLFHFYHAASIMVFCSPPTIAGVRTGRRHRRRRQYTSNCRCTHRAPSPAPSAVHPRSQAWAVTGAVRSLYPVTLYVNPQGVWQTADPHLIHAEAPKGGCGFFKKPVGRPTNYPHPIPTSQLPKVSTVSKSS